jgi:hypothetical protein
VCHDDDPKLDPKLLLCENFDSCGTAMHTFCVTPPLDEVPSDDWFCQSCGSGSIQESIPRGNNEEISSPLPSLTNPQLNASSEKHGKESADVVVVLDDPSDASDPADETTANPGVDASIVGDKRPLRSSPDMDTFVYKRPKTEQSSPFASSEDKQLDDAKTVAKQMDAERLGKAEASRGSGMPETSQEIGASADTQMLEASKVIESSTDTGMPEASQEIETSAVATGGNESSAGRNISDVTKGIEVSDNTKVQDMSRSTILLDAPEMCDVKVGKSLRKVAGITYFESVSVGCRRFKVAI